MSYSPPDSPPSTTAESTSDESTEHNIEAEKEDSTVDTRKNETERDDYSPMIVDEEIATQPAPHSTLPLPPITTQNLDTNLDHDNDMETEILGALYRHNSLQEPRTPDAHANPDSNFDSESDSDSGTGTDTGSDADTNETRSHGSDTDSSDRDQGQARKISATAPIPASLTTTSVPSSSLLSVQPFPFPPPSINPGSQVQPQNLPTTFPFVPPPHDPLIPYTCGRCEKPNLIRTGYIWDDGIAVMKMRDPLRCHECGFRVLYKVRTGRMVQFDAR
ncbi:hypothetical protein B0J11DRAFT_507582 [Dendryphion nanum]|uniref:Uncharacterized protein n=1 Tax=Dendryphion nanum TaxID=256645 RepID=A0A9P9DNQ5_9PLEO|nr:hypothetical protein B0J11DRAFT_507582 [Dendryphion nanum]